MGRKKKLKKLRKQIKRLRRLDQNSQPLTLAKARLCPHGRIRSDCPDCRDDS